MAELTHEKTGKNSYVFRLGDDEVYVRGMDPDACAARAIELLGEVSDRPIVAVPADALVIEVPRFTSEGKSDSPKAKRG